MQFRAEPATGVLGAGQEADICLTFSPAAQHRSADMHIAQVKGATHLIWHKLASKLPQQLVLVHVPGVLSMNQHKTRLTAGGRA